MIPPGETIGILGGGQLGRMLAMAAARLGYRCHVYSPEVEFIAADVCAAHTRADWHDAAALAEFAADCAVVTYEFENVPVAALGGLRDKLLPNLNALEIAQDRVSEKRFVEGLGGKPAPWLAIDTPEDLSQALDRIGSPGILKTRRDGYDGKGQWRIMADHDADGVVLTGQALVYEGFIHFTADQRDPVPRPGWHRGVLGQCRKRSRRRNPGAVDRPGQRRGGRASASRARAGREGGRGARLCRGADA